MIDSTLHRDIAGRALAVDQHVILCEHNRIIVGKIVRLFDPKSAGHSRVKIQPLNSTTGDRRPEPNAKPVIRLSYNLYLVTDQELLIAILRGHV